MPIYKSDVTKRNGKVVQGEEVTGDVIRLPYKMASSITSSGVTYVFSHMDKGEAIYKKSDTANPQPLKKIQTRDVPITDSTPTMSYEALPKGAILENDFVGGTKYINGKAYRLMQPTKKVDGKFIYLPV